MQKLVIDRQRWLRGEGIHESYLLRERDGCMCCLGFYCLSLGIPPEAITNVTTPAYTTRLATESALEVLIEGNPDEDEVFCDSEVCTQLTQTNDTPLRSRDFGVYLENEQQRELEIAQLFREHLGVEVEFIN